MKRTLLIVAIVGGVGAAPVTAQSLTTLFAGNGAVPSGGALYFDLTVGSAPVRVGQVDVNVDQPGAHVTVQLWTTPGTYVGAETNPGAWTLRATGGGTSAGLDQPTAAVLSSGPFALAAGSSQGVAIVVTGASQQRTNGTSSNQHYANADLSLDMGASANVAFAGLVFTPRVWNGTIHYERLVACYANCDGSTGAPVLNVNDFVCFQARFAAGDSYANCDGSTTEPVLNVNDFVCFQARFAAGCP